MDSGQRAISHNPQTARVRDRSLVHVPPPKAPLGPYSKPGTRLSSALSSPHILILTVSCLVPTLELGHGAASLLNNLARARRSAAARQRARGDGGGRDAGEEA